MKYLSAIRDLITKMSTAKSYSSKEVELLYWQFIEYLVLHHYDEEQDNSKEILEYFSRYIHIIVKYSDNEDNNDPKILKSNMTKYFNVVGDIACVSTIANGFVGENTSIIFDYLMDPSIKTICAKELTRTYIRILKCSDMLIKAKVIGSYTSCLYKLSDILCACGDYEYQTYLVETIFCICPSDIIKNHVVEFFPEAESLQHAFVKVDLEKFHKTCRIFLNNANHINGNVYSFISNDVFLDDVKVTPPMANDQEHEFWIDFNLGTNTIGIYCDQLCLINDPVTPDSQDNGDLGLELITFFVENVSLVEVKKLKSMGGQENMLTFFRFTLTTPFHVQYPASEWITTSKHLEIVVLDEEVIEELQSKVLPNIFNDRFKGCQSQKKYSKKANSLLMDMVFSKTIYKPLTNYRVSKRVRSRSTTSASIRDENSQALVKDDIKFNSIATNIDKIIMDASSSLFGNQGTSSVIENQNKQKRNNINVTNKEAKSSISSGDERRMISFEKSKSDRGKRKLSQFDAKLYEKKARTKRRVIYDPNDLTHLENDFAIYTKQFETSIHVQKDKQNTLKKENLLGKTNKTKTITKKSSGTVGTRLRNKKLQDENSQALVKDDIKFNSIATNIDKIITDARSSLFGNQGTSSVIENQNKQKNNDTSVVNNRAKSSSSSDDEPLKYIEVHALVHVDAELEEQDKRVVHEVKSTANKNEKSKLLNYSDGDKLDEIVTTETQPETIEKATEETTRKNKKRSFRRAPLIKETDDTHNKPEIGSRTKALDDFFTKFNRDIIFTEEDRKRREKFDINFPDMLREIERRQRKPRRARDLKIEPQSNKPAISHGVSDASLNNSTPKMKMLDNVLLTEKDHRRRERFCFGDITNISREVQRRERKHKQAKDLNTEPQSKKPTTIDGVSVVVLHKSTPKIKILDNVLLKPARPLQGLLEFDEVEEHTNQIESICVQRDEQKIQNKENLLGNTNKTKTIPKKSSGTVGTRSRNKTLKVTEITTRNAKKLSSRKAPLTIKTDDKHNKSKRGPRKKVLCKKVLDDFFTKFNRDNIVTDEERKRREKFRRTFGDITNIPNEIQRLKSKPEQARDFKIEPQFKKPAISHEVFDAPLKNSKPKIKILDVILKPAGPLSRTEIEFDMLVKEHTSQIESKGMADS